MRRVRCAIYTRKSSEDGLEQDFNSLDAQREACEAYIASQKHEGWELRPEYYDDGGISGGHLERPALQALMQAVDDKRVDQIVVYKIDRLTRSLADFAKLVDRLDAAETSFVSVTQSFNTATSMGRLTLNMLLSFAQFEREVTAERIRDKIAASKRKGLWMGGNVPFGYHADGRTLKTDEVEAATIKALYNLYIELGSVRKAKEEASLRGLRMRLRQRSDGRVTGGTSFGRGHLYHILSNPIYAGRIRHKREVFEGRHPAIIEPEAWEQVQDRLAGEASRVRGANKAASTSPLAGKVYDETGDRLTPSHSKKNGRRLRYYISRRLVTGTREEHPDAWRLPAKQFEALLAKAVSKDLAQPDFVMRLIKDVVATEIPSLVGGLSIQSAPEASIALIDRVDLEQGQLCISLNADRMADRLGIAAMRIVPEALHFTSGFQTRRRGVELKLQLGTEPSSPDRVLVHNILLAQRWLEMIIDGKTFSQIATAEGTSKRRVQDVVDLAMLEPKFLEQIARGEQPGGLTTDYLIKSGVPALWTDQQERFAQL